jgi:Uma2 family endonuclease
MGAIKRAYVEGPPDVAVEIVSPDSVDRDYEDKRYHYEAAGVQEYWIIDVEESRATFLQQGTGGFVEMAVEDHVFRSRAIPGFAIDVRWLWQRPLPKALGIVQEMLKNAPLPEGD